MQTAPAIKVGDLPEFLLNAATVAPVFLWGPPGVGKTALVEQFAAELGMDCVSLLGTQLAPEDLLGVPRVHLDPTGATPGYSVFCPPRQLVRDKPFVVLCDELNAAQPDVQKSFYQLVAEKRLGELRLPEGSVVIAAGNRATDNAIVRPMSSALVNRMVHVTVEVDAEAWLQWAAGPGQIHPVVFEYVNQHRNHLSTRPPKEERTFSTPRSWHLLSTLLHSWQGSSPDDLPVATVRQLSRTLLTAEHAQLLEQWYRNREDAYLLNRIFKGEASWPDQPADRGLLHYLTMQFRAQLLKEIPGSREQATGARRDLVTRSLELLRSLADLSADLAATTIVPDDAGRELPSWFVIEIGNELPAITARAGR